MFEFIKQLFCKHNYMPHKRAKVDNVTAFSEKCTRCGKLRFLLKYDD